MIARIIFVVIAGLFILGIFFLDDRSKYRKYLELQRRRRELAAAVKKQESEEVKK